MDRAFKTTGGDVKQKERILETWLELRVVGAEEKEGVSQRVPGLGRGTPSNNGAAVE